MAGDIYFEFHFVGSLVKVCAIDADSGIEVSIMGPRNTNQRELENVAKAKLAYMIAKEHGTEKGKWA